MRVESENPREASLCVNGIPRVSALNPHPSSLIRGDNQLEPVGVAEAEHTHAPRHVRRFGIECASALLDPVRDIIDASGHRILPVSYTHLTLPTSDLV